jgi:light-regulated signal transduction histidine kinase (bacteriophytochrome)
MSDDAIGRRPGPLRITLLLAGTIAIGWLDYATGPDIGFSLIYLIPIVLAAWIDGSAATIAVAVAASTAWFLADYFWHHTTLAITLWNSFTRFSIYTAIGVLIAHQRKSQASLQKANEQLESFSRSVSHDLRAPLIHIGRYSELLGERAVALDDTGRHQLSLISRSATDGLMLIDDLLQFAQMQRTEVRRGPVDLNAMVATIRRNLELSAPDRKIRWQIETLPAVRGDAAMLQVAIRNLLENAVKYTRSRDEAIITVGSYERDHFVVVFVRDNGVGFDPRYTNKLFRVFERLHGQTEFEGTGIGLALVREIVTRHGGQVWADGQLDAGATFHISLPVRT